MKTESNHKPTTNYLPCGSNVGARLQAACIGASTPEAGRFNYMELQARITEDVGFNSVRMFLKTHESVNIALSEIGNHKGDWVVKFREGVSLINKLTAINCLVHYAIGDVNIYEDGTTYNLHELFR